MVLAAFITTCFVIGGASAWYLRRGVHAAAASRMLKHAVAFAAIAVPLQIFAGDLHGLNTLEHQPAKIAAMEGIWETERGAPILLFGLPNAKERRNDYAIGVPKVASFILTHDFDGEIRGLAEFPDHPPVLPVFWAFRVMVGMGMLMLAVSWWSAFTLWRRRSTAPASGADAVPFSTWQLRLLAGMTFSGWVATLAGWYVTEIGRQPFLVYGLLRTADLVADHPPAMVLTTLIAWLAVYAFLLLAYIAVLMYMASHPAQPTAQTPQSPKAALPVGGPA
jgi:cytochrome d ubiquinol oxidase subunit I